MPSLENAKFLAARVSSRHVETFYLDNIYHVLTLDKRKDDVADHVAKFFLRHETSIAKLGAADSIIGMKPT